jgi:hypothetical protein
MMKKLRKSQEIFLGNTKNKFSIYNLRGIHAFTAFPSTKSSLSTTFNYFENIFAGKFLIL